MKRRDQKKKKMKVRRANEKKGKTKVASENDIRHEGQERKTEQRRCK